MKRACILLLVLGATVLAAGPAGAFTWEWNQTSTGKWYPKRWPEETRRVRFVLNDRVLELLPNFTRDSAPQAAVEGALQTWAIAPPGMYLDGLSAKTDVGKDGVNLITFADTPKNRDAVKDANGLAFVWIKDTKLASQPYWSMQEADVVMSPTVAWSTSGAPGTWDAQSVLTHELGHALGLGHTLILGSTMCPGCAHEGQIHLRVLDGDDIAGMRELYNIPTPDRGAIAGRVLGADGKPVFGVHVVPVDADGIIAVTVLTGKDGTFKVPSLFPGDFDVYVEPARGVFSAQDLDAYYRGMRTDILPVFAGAPSFPSIHVTAGATTSIEPITIQTGQNRISPDRIADSLDGRPRHAYRAPVVVSPGGRTYLTVVGTGLDTVTGIGVSGHDVAMDYSRARQDRWSNDTWYITVPITVRSQARPGSRSLFLENDNEFTAMTGAIRVVAPQ